MTLKEFYEYVDGDYEELLRRLGDETRIKRILGMLLRDDTVEKLEEALAKKDLEAAFRAAHTLKGVAMNLELKSLRVLAEDLTEHLRARREDEEIYLLAEMVKDCEQDIRDKVSALMTQ